MLLSYALRSDFYKHKTTMATIARPASKKVKARKAASTSAARKPVGTEGALAEAQYLIRAFETYSADRSALFTRMLRELPRMISAMTPEQIMLALSSPTDAGALIRAFANTVASDKSIGMLDPAAEPILRGAERKRELLEHAGGTYGTSELTQLLGVSQQAIDQRVRRGKLLAIRTPSGDLRFPKVQFLDTGTIPGLEKVLSAFNIESPWTRLAILLSADDAVGGQRIIDALRRGQIEQVLDAVSSYGG